MFICFRRSRLDNLRFAAEEDFSIKAVPYGSHQRAGAWTPNCTFGKTVLPPPGYIVCSSTPTEDRSTLAASPCDSRLGDKEDSAESSLRPSKVRELISTFDSGLVNGSNSATLHVSKPDPSARHAAKVRWGAVTAWPKPLSPAALDTSPHNTIRAIHPSNCSPQSPLPCSWPALQMGWEALSNLARQPANDSNTKPAALWSPTGPPNARCTSPVSRGLGSPVRFSSRQMGTAQSSGERRYEREPLQEGCTGDRGLDRGDAAVSCGSTASLASTQPPSGRGKAWDCGTAAIDPVERIPFPLLCELWVDRTLLVAFLMVAVLVCLGGSDASSPAFSRGA